MKLKGPEDQKSINVGGVEYTADGDGCVTIGDVAHITVAQNMGWVQVPMSPPAPETGYSTADHS